jgi:hypothetical protein
MARDDFGQGPTTVPFGLSLPSAMVKNRVRLHKGTKRDIELCLVSDAHDCLPAGFEMACDG